MLRKVSQDYQRGVGLVRVDLSKEVEELMEGNQQQHSKFVLEKKKKAERTQSQVRYAGHLI